MLIYRGGDPTPSNLRPRPQDNGRLSFRDSLSNPVPVQVISLDHRPVFGLGSTYFAVDTSLLPSVAVLLDDDPPGHVSVVNVPVETLKAAIVERGRFPKGDLP